MLTMAFMHCFIVTILTMECFAVANRNMLSMGWRDKWNILHIICFFVLSSLCVMYLMLSVFILTFFALFVFIMCHVSNVDRVHS